MSPRKTYTAAPEMTIDQNKRYFATVETDAGEMRLELFPKDAPIHVNNFVFLARDGYYDGLVFHRVEPGFVVQTGDPQGTGRGGPGYNIQDEKTTRAFETGTLGMAKTAAPNSAGSQWFICLGPAPHLTANYTAFGQLVSGQETLQQIRVGTKMTKVTIEEQ